MSQRRRHRTSCLQVCRIQVRGGAARPARHHAKMYEKLQTNLKWLLYIDFLLHDSDGRSCITGTIVSTVTHYYIYFWLQCVNFCTKYQVTSSMSSEHEVIAVSGTRQLMYVFRDVQLAPAVSEHPTHGKFVFFFRLCTLVKNRHVTNTLHHQSVS